MLIKPAAIADGAAGPSEPAPTLPILSGGTMSSSPARGRSASPMLGNMQQFALDEPAAASASSLHSPPDSTDATKCTDSDHKCTDSDQTESELSDLDSDEHEQLDRAMAEESRKDAPPKLAQEQDEAPCDGDDSARLDQQMRKGGKNVHQDQPRQDQPDVRQDMRQDGLGEDEPEEDEEPEDEQPEEDEEQEDGPDEDKDQEDRPEEENEQEDGPEDDQDDIGEVLPDHWSGGTPIFKPTMEQFKCFKRFMEAVDEYGMKTGIIKIIPPREWRDQLPPIDDLVKQIRIREPIKQDIMGSNGTYRQVNLLHGRSYNVPQWRQLCDQSEHQPPARRGERRNNPAPRPPRAAAAPRAPAAAGPSAPRRRGKGAGSRSSRRGRAAAAAARREKASREEAGTEDDPEREDAGDGDGDAKAGCAGHEQQQPMTPVSPIPAEDAIVESVEIEPDNNDNGPAATAIVTEAVQSAEKSAENVRAKQSNSDPDKVPEEQELGIKVEEDGDDEDEDDGGGDDRPKTQSVSARRKYSRREASLAIDEEAFRGWDYRMDVSDFTPERCEELERIYWKTLTYAPPLYGADLMGTLFHESTAQWNLNRLPNLLDVLGTRVPGVNTAYLYLGMWKATFAWHLEDVDLYSINYLHFGAPKQWYSIPQPDARRFEAAMRNIWPTEAKACDQFLRHKAFLISPQHLQQHYNIRVNRVVSYPGEFIVTYPYGYHSGYNLGYNCAEAVNFALDSWLAMGKIARRCQCAQAQDSVWIDVYDMERKLRGEESEPDESDDDDDEDGEGADADDEDMAGLPTPPASSGVRFRPPAGVAARKRRRPPAAPRSRKRARTGAAPPAARRRRTKPRAHPRPEPPCCLCPNDIPAAEILDTDDGRRAHRMCALYLPETYIDTVHGRETIANVPNIDKNRLALKCLFCRSRKGACFQCSQKKCARAYHATCAAAAGVFVEEAEVPVFGEDGTEYREQAFEFSCRFHRTRRDRALDGAHLEEDSRIRAAARALRPGDICQLQYRRGEIFAGAVVENRPDEETLLLDIIPAGDQLEVEWKWLLLPDPADYRLPRASASAVPLPSSRKEKDEINAKRAEDDTPPRRGGRFVDGHVWAEFNVSGEIRNEEQVPVDLEADGRLWHYIGETSTDARPHYSADPSRSREHDPRSNYLDTLPKPARAPRPPRPSAGTSASSQRRRRQSAQATTAAATAAVAAAAAIPTAAVPAAEAEVDSSTPTSTLTRPVKPYIYRPRKACFGGPGLPALTVGTLAPAVAPSGGAPYLASTLSQTTGTDPRVQLLQQSGSESAPQLPLLSDAQNVLSSPAPVFAQVQGQAPAQAQVHTPGQLQLAAHAQQLPPTQFLAKYPYFQTRHNRDRASYRTPYRSGLTGFTNGYEGDLRAYLAANNDIVSSRYGVTLSTSQDQVPQGLPPAASSLTQHLLQQATKVLAFSAHTPPSSVYSSASTTSSHYTAPGTAHDGTSTRSGSNTPGPTAAAMRQGLGTTSGVPPRPVPAKVSPVPLPWVPGMTSVAPPPPYVPRPASPRRRRPRPRRAAVATVNGVPVDQRRRQSQTPILAPAIPTAATAINSPAPQEHQGQLPYTAASPVPTPGSHPRPALSGLNNGLPPLQIPQHQQQYQPLHEPTQPSYTFTHQTTPPATNPETPAQPDGLTHDDADLADVPADSMLLMECMLVNLRRASLRADH